MKSISVQLMRMERNMADMAAATLQDRIVRYMQYFNYTEVPSNTRRYRLFKTTVRGEGDRVYFVGKTGGVRCSKTGSIKDSYDVTELLIKHVQTWEREQEQGTRADG